MPSARSFPLALGLSVLLLPGLAHAAGNPADEARLEYLRGPGAESCPGEEALRDGVAAQMGGADPFTPYGLKRVVVTISRAPRSFEGEFALYNADGALVGRRPMGATTCAGLAQDLASPCTRSASSARGAQVRRADRGARGVVGDGRCAEMTSAYSGGLVLDRQSLGAAFLALAERLENAAERAD